MQATVEEISGFKKKVTITIPSERVDSEIEKYFADAQKSARLQGFRIGKAPMQLVRHTFKGSMQEEVKLRLHQQTFSKALEEQNIELIDSPTIESDIPEQGNPFTYSAVVDVMPEIQLKAYIGLAATKETYLFKPENIEAELKQMQANLAQLIPLDADAVVEKGHNVTVDFTYIG